MRFSSRSKVSTVFSFAALSILIGAFAFYGAFGGRQTAQAAGSATTYTSSKGSIKVAGTGDLTKTGPSATQSQDGKVVPMRTVPKAGVSAHASSVGRPSAKGVPFAAGRLLQNFDGVNAIQSRSVNQFNVEPPDEALAVGNGYVMNAVNEAFIIYNTSGSIVAGPVNIANFVGEPSAFVNGTTTSDPRAYYDKATNTWFLVIWSYDNGSVSGVQSSSIHVAVNTSGNPLTKWTLYNIDTTNAGGNGVNDANCPCFPDYTILGIDQYNLYLSGQEFPITNAGNTNGSEIYVVSKSQLESSATANYVRFGSLSIAGTIAYHVQPAVTHGNANAEYFMNSLDPNSTFDNRIGVWAITNRQAVTTGVGTPNLSSTVISSEAYGFPVNAQTPVGYNFRIGQATTGLLNPDFDAMQEVQYINGHLVGALNTSITIPGDTSARDGNAWFQVSPKLSGSVISGSTKVSAQGYIASQGNFLLYPHIEQSADGTTAMTFSVTGPNTYPSAAYAVKTAGSANFGSVQIAGAGVTSDNGFTCTPKVQGICRWGDYSAGQLDPNSNNIWFATQYIPNNGNSTVNWGNRVFEVSA